MIADFKQKYLEELVSTPIESLADKPMESAEILLAKQLVDGSFVDVEFNIENERNDFVKLHLIRVRNLAWYYCNTGNQLFLKGVNNGLKWWRDNVFISNNWWENLVVTPRMFIQILYLVGDEITEDLKRYLEITIADTLDHIRHERDIGANTVMLGTNKFLYAVYKGDMNLLEKCRQRLCEELRFADDHIDGSKGWRSNHWKNYVNVDFEYEVYEGVQRDFSFFEHGPMLYTGGYGNIYLNEFTKIVRIVNGTDFFSEENINFLVDYFLEHMVWTLNGDRFDFNVVGRSIVYSKEDNNIPNPIVSILATVTTSIKDLLDSNIDYRRNELLEAYNSIITNKPVVTGNRYFNIGQYISHKRHNYFTSVRLSSSKVIGTESVNWVNISGWHSADGVQYVYVKGDEYEDIFSAWDWTKLPGATTVQRTQKPLDYKQSIHLKGSHSNYCGGVSDGNCGAAAMFLERDLIKAKKAWFMFDKECVCLGTGIISEENFSVTTTINQTLAQGIVETDCREISYGEYKLPETKWVYHNNITYHFPTPAEVNLKFGKMTANRHDVNRQYRPIKPNTPDYVSKDVFCLWVDHGKNIPSGDYAYIIIPDTQAGEFTVNSEIIVNNESIQAVKNNDILQIVFWQKTHIELESMIFKVDNPCVVLISADIVKVSALDVRENTFSISINGEEYKAN